MDQVVVLCVDGSDDAVAAASAGLERLAPARRTIIATIVEAGDPMLVTGASGVAGGLMTPEQFDEVREGRRREGEEVLAEAARDLDLPDAEQVLRIGPPGPELVALAEEVGATVVVAGSRGRGGVKRALLGSVSDHLVRNARCPVLVVRDAVAEQPDE